MKIVITDEKRAETQQPVRPSAFSSGPALARMTPAASEAILPDDAGGADSKGAVTWN